ncbi:MAG TPA: PEP-CTERM sorting domain-containing protein [Burkholderiaceae bacterium]|nr:PEP-CTERM sorting domain-containing protein [Burkholderiaceae bacterium]
MLMKTCSRAVGAALLAVCQLASADVAEVKISNLSLSASGGEWWYWLPTEVGWLTPTAGTAAGLQDPSLAHDATGWHGNALGSSVSDGVSQATASLSAKTSSDINGAGASAKVQVSNGQSGWAFAKVFEGQIMVGGHATLTASFALDSIFASGAMSQANAYIQFCSTDFVTDTCSEANYAEAFVSGGSPGYSGPSILTASWTNPGETAWAKIQIGLTASAESAVGSVPEPATPALLLASMAGMALIARRRGASRAS